MSIDKGIRSCDSTSSREIKAECVLELPNVGKHGENIVWLIKGNNNNDDKILETLLFCPYAFFGPGRYYCQNNRRQNYKGAHTLKLEINFTAGNEFINDTKFEVISTDFGTQVKLWIFGKPCNHLRFLGWNISVLQYIFLWCFSYCFNEPTAWLSWKRKIK